MSFSPPKLYYPESGNAGCEIIKDDQCGPVGFWLWERFTVTSAQTASVALKHQQPARSIIKYHSIKQLNGAASVTTATHISLGIVSDVDEFDEIAVGDLGANEEVLSTPDDAQALITAARSLYITPTNGSGVLAGQINSCDLFIVVWGELLPNIRDYA